MPPTTDVAANVARYRAVARQSKDAAKFLGDVLGLGTRVASYKTDVPYPPQQLKNKLAQAAAKARDGLLHLTVQDRRGHDHLVEALVERWFSNPEWSKDVAAVAVAYPDSDGLRIGTVVHRCPFPAAATVQDVLFPDAAVVAAKGFPRESESLDTPPAEPQGTVVDEVDELFIDKAEVDHIVQLLARKKNVVLQGPPGVGKTFIARKVAAAFVGGDLARERLVQFHQSYAYEDFVQGWRPAKEGGFRRRDGVFVTFCDKARADMTRPYVLLVDEINRGNLSKIFGELLMLIEDDKRGIEVQLAYFDPELDKDDDGAERLRFPRHRATSSVAGCRARRVATPRPS